jgi:hypothetical protein
MNYLLIPNILVAISNLYFYYLVKDKNINLLLYFPMIASFLYHFAETRHKLPGIPLLNKYDRQILVIDRIGAIMSGLIMINKLYYYPELLTYNFIFTGLFGFACLVFSDRDIFAEKLFNNNSITVSQFEFTISHIIWHMCAFYCFASIL